MLRPRPLAIFGIIAILLAIVLCVLISNPQARPSSGAMFIREGDPGDIRNINFANAYGEFEIRYSGDGYEVHDIPAPLVDYARFLQLMGDCASLRASRIAADRASEPALYGLDAPVAVVCVQYASGPDLEFYLGNVEPVSRNIYFSVKGKSPVYLMDGDSAANFLCSAKEYIDLLVTEGTDLSSPLSAVVDATFEWPQTDLRIVIASALRGGEEMRRTALSFGAVSHLVYVGGVGDGDGGSDGGGVSDGDGGISGELSGELSGDGGGEVSGMASSDGGYAFELDQTYGVELFGSLLGIKAVDVEAYNCTEAMLEQLGMLVPSLIVDFSYISGVDGKMHDQTLSFAKTGEGQYLVRRGNEDIVYRVDYLPFMDIDLGRLMTRWYLSPLIMDLSGVTVIAGEQRLDFLLVGAEPNADKRILLDGHDFDIVSFRKFFRLLTSAAHDGEQLTCATHDGELLTCATHDGKQLTSATHDGEQLTSATHDGEQLTSTTHDGELLTSAQLDAIIDGNPQISIEYKYLDGLKLPDIIEFYRGPVRKLIAVVNGKPINYGMRESYALRVSEACAAIAESRDFDINW